MCGLAIPIVAAGLAMAAAAVSAASQFQQAKGEAAQYDRDAKVARQQGAFDAQRQQRDIRRQLGALHASAASSGIQSGAGSPLDIAADLTAEAELEPFEQIRRGLIQFQDLKTAAKRTRSAAGANLLSSSLQAGSSALSMMGP
ncbi:MAG: hypothetical protein WD044_00050 [Dongiaceae bacterium]